MTRKAQARDETAMMTGGSEIGIAEGMTGQEGTVKERRAEIGTETEMETGREGRSESAEETNMMMTGEVRNGTAAVAGSEATRKTRRGRSE